MFLVLAPAGYLAAVSSANWLLENILIPMRVRQSEDGTTESVTGYDIALTASEEQALKATPRFHSLFTAARARREWYDKLDKDNQ